MPIVNVEDLQKTASNVSQTALELVSKINQSQKLIDENIAFKIGDAPLLESQRSEWERARNGIRREILKASDEDRWSRLRVMTEAEQQVIEAEKQFASPSVILMRAGLGSEQRSRYLEQIANSGPLELASYADLAQRTGNQVLGASVLTVLDSKTKKQRDVTGISRAKLAESLAGDQFRAAQSAIKRIKVTVRESLATNRAFEHGKAVDGQTKVGIAQQRKEANATN